MQNSRIRFDTGIDELNRLIELVGLLDEVSAAESATPSGEAIAAIVRESAWRKQSYSFLIVFLYGHHERLCRDLLEAAARMVSKLYSSYAEMPDKIRAEHARLTMAALREITDRDPHASDNMLDLMSTLASALGGSPILNSSLFTRHTANFRSETVRESFRRLQVSIEPCPVALPEALDGLYMDIDSAIDDLANRRNDIAHGNSVEIVDLATATALVEAVTLYDHWLIGEVAQSLLSSLVAREGILSGVVTRVWRDMSTGVRSICQIDDVLETIRLGSNLYGAQSRRYKVVEIRSPDGNVEKACAGAGVHSINLGGQVSVKHQLLQLPSRWSPVEAMLVRQLGGGADS